jgi:hypothetical protein
MLRESSFLPWKGGRKRGKEKEGVREGEREMEHAAFYLWIPSAHEV